MLDQASFKIIPNQKDSFSINPQIGLRKPLKYDKIIDCILLIHQP